MNPPFDRALLHLLHRASQVADEIFASESADLDLTPRQFVVLATIGNLEGPSQTDIVARTGIDRSTLADITRRLVKKKLIGRCRAKDDVRAHVLTVTPEGKERLKRAYTSLMAAEGVLQSALSVQELDSLSKSLETIASLHRSCDGWATSTISGQCLTQLCCAQAQSRLWVAREARRSSDRHAAEEAAICRAHCSV